MQVFASNALSICLYLIVFCFLFVGFRLIFVLSTIYSNIEIMRNNNKELKFEFGKHLADIRTTKNEKGTALRLG